MKYYLIAGEASGDLHASNLMHAIKQKDSDADFRFFGGDMMKKAGGTLVKHYKELAFMGFIPVLLNLKTILRSLRLCKKDIVAYNPDIVILVDYPGFNLKIAKFIKLHTTIPVTYYISPKIWAWKEYRIKAFKKYVDQMLCILPFETEFYKKHDYKVDYVGNPTVDAITNYRLENETFEEFAVSNNLDHRPIIAILAGSRKQEIRDNLPTMLAALKHFSNYQIVIAGAPGIEKEYYLNYSSTVKDDVTLIFGKTYDILHHSKVALITSGTATLEAALLNTPQVVCYKTPLPKITYWAFKHILHTPYISLVNLIANKEVVKELFAIFFTIDHIKEETDRLLHDNKYRQLMIEEYRRIQIILGNKNASDKAATLIINTL